MVRNDEKVRKLENVVFNLKIKKKDIIKQ